MKEILLERACKDDLDEEGAKDLIEYNLKILGINMVWTKMKKSESGVISLSHYSAKAKWGNWKAKHSPKRLESEMVDVL